MTSANAQIEEEIATYKRAIEERIAEYERGYENYIATLSERYKEKDLVEKASNKYANLLFSYIKTSDRASHIPKVEETIVCQVMSYKIDGPGKDYVFEYYRMANVCAKPEQEALLHALAEKIREKVILKLESFYKRSEEKDVEICSERYTVDIRYRYNDYYSAFEATISYTENNPNFVPVQQW